MQTLDITVKSMAAPKAANPEKGWSGTKNYQVFSEDGTKYLASPNIGIGSVQENDKISITIGNPDRFGNLYIKSFEPVTAPTFPGEVPQEIKKAFPDSKVVSSNGYAQIQPQAPTSSMTMKDFLIVLQSCCNRDSTMTADQKLKFILDNYKAGLIATHKRLSESSDSF
tara:strand:- start:1678 stop:2181 length:504 start_codon:yes stop_codon:yes gene_type:complete